MRWPYFMQYLRRTFANKYGACLETVPACFLMTQQKTLTCQRGFKGICGDCSVFVPEFVFACQKSVVSKARLHFKSVKCHERSQRVQPVVTKQPVF
mmetsp:Transcript_5566/g.15961  ORF Transcript_5566/g.15961 Transcript_5566/m.15961 type:complete len:96 (+) Transcript_5566:99-386(+)